MNKQIKTDSVFDVPYLYLTLSCFMLLEPIGLCVARKRVESSLADDGLKKEDEKSQWRGLNRCYLPKVNFILSKWIL